MSVLEVIHSSDKSIFVIISLYLLLSFIFSSASKLEPISLLALFSSILILQTSLILISSDHFLASLTFSKFFGKVKNFSK